jgi:hypothetical protein
VIFTEQDDVDVRLAELLGQRLPLSSRSVVGVVDNDLASFLEKIPDQFFTPVGYPLPHRDRFRGFLP